MEIAVAVQWFVAINILVVGLSHLLQPGVWILFFQRLAKMGQPGNLLNAMLSLGMGSLIVGFHQIWTWPMILVTIYGLLLTVKGALYMIIPKIGLKSIEEVNDSSGAKFRIIGTIMAVLGGLLSIHLII